MHGDAGGHRLLPCLAFPSLAASQTVSQVAKECVAALAAAARSGPDSIKDAAQLALTECTDDVCQGACIFRVDWMGHRPATAAVGFKRCCSAICPVQSTVCVCRRPNLFPVPGFLAAVQAWQPRLRRWSVPTSGAWWPPLRHMSAGVDVWLAGHLRPLSGGLLCCCFFAWAP